MAYSATNWVDGTTPVNATNLNKLEGGVSDLSDQVDELNSYLSYQFNVTDPITEQADALPNRQWVFGYCNASGYPDVDLPSSTFNYFVVAVRYGSNQGQIIAIPLNRAQISIRSKSGGTWNSSWTTVL